MLSWVTDGHSHTWKSVFLEWEPGFPERYPQWFVISYSFSYRDSRPTPLSQGPPAFLGVSVLWSGSLRSQECTHNGSSSLFLLQGPQTHPILSGFSSILGSLVFLEWEPGFPGGYPQWFIISLSLTGTPDPPHSLRVLQRSWESVFLEWEPRFPGVYPQWFIISLSLTGTPDPPHSLRVLQHSWESVFLE